MISLLISMIVLAIIVAVALWLIRYLNGPDILVKIIVVLAVLIALLMLLDGLGVYDFHIYHRGVGGVYVQ